MNTYKLPIKSFKWLFVLVGVATLSGCTSYRSQMKDFQDNPPPSYLERTLEYTKSDDSQSSNSLTAMPSRNFLVDEFAPTDKFVELASEFYGIDHATIQQASELFVDDNYITEMLSGEVNPDDLLMATAFLNPTVLAARHRWEATLRQYSQAEFLDNLIAEYRTFTKYLNVGAGNALNKEMTKRFFPWPGMIGLKGEVVDQQVRLAEYNWQKSLRESVVKSGELFYQLQYVWRAEETTKSNVSLAEDLLRIVNQRYRVGKATQADLIKIQTELERQLNKLADLGNKKLALNAKINAQLNRSSDSPIGEPLDTDLPVVIPGYDYLEELALNSRQEVAIQRTRVRRLEAAIRLGEVMNRPIASQGYSNFERGVNSDGSYSQSDPSFGLMAMQRDQPEYAQREAYLSEIRERLQAETAQLDQVMADTIALTIATIQSLEIAQREVDLVYNIVVPQSRSAYDVSLSGYTSGKVGFLDLFDAERSLLKSRLEKHAAIRDWNTARLNVARVSGDLKGAWTDE